MNKSDCVLIGGIHGGKTFTVSDADDRIVMIRKYSGEDYSVTAPNPDNFDIYERSSVNPREFMMLCHPKPQPLIQDQDYEPN